MMAAKHTGPSWRFPNEATPPGSTLYYSLRFAPAEQRDTLATLHAWRRAVRAIPHEVSEPSVAAVKLRWWHEELELSLQGRARHPLTRALAPAIQGQDLPIEPFLEVVGEAEGLLEPRIPSSFAAMAASAEHDLGAIQELVARCHGITAPTHLLTARRLGGFAALVEHIRDSGRLLRAGDPGVLPADRLDGKSVSRAVLLEPEQRRRVQSHLAEMAADLDAYRSRIQIETSVIPVSIRIETRLREQLLSELRRSGLEVLDQRISLTPIRKLWHAWRESRR